MPQPQELPPGWSIDSRGRWRATESACSKCGFIKPYGEFNYDSGKTNRNRSLCRDCESPRRRSERAPTGGPAWAARVEAQLARLNAENAELRSRMERLESEWEA